MHCGSLFERKNLSSIYLLSDSYHFLGNLQAFFLASRALLLDNHLALMQPTLFREDELTLSISAILSHVLSDRYLEEYPFLILLLIVYCDRQEILEEILQQDATDCRCHC